MTRAHAHAGQPSTPRWQQGVALLTVSVLVMLSGLLALWASRTTLFHELVVGNAADHQRAQEAAEALLHDAYQDLALHHAGGRHPRTARQAHHFPADNGAAFEAFLDQLQAEQPTSACLHGLCAKRRSEVDFWLDHTTLAQMTAPGVGARYGDYTEAPAPAHDTLLTERAASKGGWYWIEVLRHRPAEGPGTSMAPNVPTPFLYRITALARGLRAGSQVVLQSVVAFPAVPGE